VPLDEDSETNDEASRSTEDERSVDEESIAASEEHLIDPPATEEQPL
jgi:hypothetical protein